MASHDLSKPLGGTRSAQEALGAGKANGLEAPGAVKMAYSRMSADESTSS